MKKQQKKSEDKDRQWEDSRNQGLPMHGTGTNHENERRHQAPAGSETGDMTGESGISSESDTNIRNTDRGRIPSSEGPVQDDDGDMNMMDERDDPDKSLDLSQDK